MRIIALTIIALIIEITLCGSSVSAVNIAGEDMCSDPRLAGSTFCQAQEGNDTVLWGDDGILTKVIQILVYVLTIISVIVIVIAGMRFATSGGNPQTVGVARNAIIYAAVGLIIALLAQALVSFVLSRLGGGEDVPIEPTGGTPAV